MSAPTSFFRQLASTKMLIVFLLGFSSGLPLLLTSGTLKVWLARENVDLSLIGYFGWVGLAYSLKFLWAPILDRFALSALGRRRSWMLAAQLALIAAIAAFALCDPSRSLTALATVALLTAILSATQDIAVDAYRREILSDEEMGLGASIYTYGYRVGMLVSGGIGISLVGSVGAMLSWPQLYLVMALLMLVGVVTTLVATEPQISGSPPRTLLAAIREPLAEFLKREGAWIILLFLVLFKLGDAVSGAMLNPFYVHIGFSNTDIGLIAKTFGFVSTLVGLFLGGAILFYIGVYRSLWIFGLLQAVSTVAFAALTVTGPQMWALACTVCFEDLSSGMGTAALVAFTSVITDKRYTATQYAVLTSLAAVGRTFFSGFAGDLVVNLGWANFYLASGAVAVPGLLLLVAMRNNSSVFHSEAISQRPPDLDEPQPL